MVATCFTNFAGITSTSLIKNGWIIDSGVSNHISGDISVIIELRELTKENQ